MLSNMFNTEQLLLQHSDFSAQYCAGFNELRKANELFDVTLGTEDEVIDAHKVLLSANSPFFRKIIAKTKNREHPFIYLKGIKTEHLKIALDFIYNGEALIPTPELDKFLAMAQELEINGLAEDEVKSENESVKKECDISKERKKKISKGKSNEKVKVPLEENLKNVDMSLEVSDQETASGNTSADEYQFEELSVKVEPIITEDPTEKTVDVKLNIDEDILQRLKAEIKDNVQSISDSEGKTILSCKICGKVLSKRGKLYDHIENHLEKYTFPCNYCSKVMKSRKGLRSHIIYNHTKKE